MQTVFNNSMVAHVWAQQTQAHGRNAGNTFYFEGPTIYSYGEHFPIATFVTTPKGAQFVAFTTEGYSTTTAAHISHARRAVSGHTIDVPNPMIFQGRTLEPDDLDAIAEAMRAQFTEALEKASRARTYKAHHLERAQQIARDASWLAEQYDHPALAIAMPDDIGEALEQARTEARERQQREAERERERRDAMKHAEAERFKQWRAGELVSFPWSWSPEDDTALLTLSADGQTIRTSKGAEFPADHARRVWPILRRLRQEQQHGSDLYPRSPGKPLRLGMFSIDTLEPGGTVRAGCHRVHWDEVERIAKILGLEPVEV